MSMSYELCLSLAVFALVIGIAATFRVKNSRAVTVRPLTCVMIGTFVAGIFMFMPVYYAQFRNDDASALKTLLLSVHNTIRLFVVDSDFDIIREYVPQDMWIGGPYAAFASILYVLSPVLTFGLILSLIMNAFAHFAFLMAFFRDVFVFSELNARSVALADSIKRKNRRAKIVFTDVYETDSEEFSELSQVARTIGAILFKSDIEYVDYAWHSKSSKITVFVIGDKEPENLRQAIHLIHQNRNRTNMELYVFSATLEGEMILSDQDKGKLKVRRINENHALINKYLYEEGEGIFDSATEERNAKGEREIRALIAGVDKYGFEMFRSLSWLCQMDGYRFYMAAYDQDPLIEDKIRAKCPGLLDENLNGKDIPGGDAFYDIKVHADTDFDTAAFYESAIDFAPTFIFISLGDDSENVKVAVKLRSTCEKNGIRPKIVTICTDPYINEGLGDIHNFRGEKYDISFIGSLNDMYTGNSIIGRELEEEALKRHLKWGSEDDFWSYEYNYKSSIATTIHAKMKKHCGIEGALKSEDELTEHERETLERLEHSRWNAYMRSEGYEYRKDRSDLALLHNDLLPFDELTEEEKRKDSKVASAVESE